MSSRRKSGLVIAAVVVGLAAGLFFYVATGPKRTLQRLADALAARDAAALSDCIDFPKLKDNLKRELEERAKRSSAGLFAQNSIASLANGLASSLSDTLVDSLVTPRGLEVLLAGESVFVALGAPVPGAATERATLIPLAIDQARYHFESLSTFVVTVQPRPGVTVDLVLGRTFLDWKLERVRLPE
jgi:hypothetical protein